MRYSGGKGKIAAKLAAAVLRFPHKRIVEPFCGGLSMTAALQPAEAADDSLAVITLINAVRSGWQPPTSMNDEQYRALKDERADLTDPMVCFAGHCASFGGKWFGGLARGHVRQREPIRAAAVTLQRRVAQCEQTKFSKQDYAATEIREGDLIYCDPPYAGTTNGYACADFDHARFWDWCRSAPRGAIVLVSEYQAPPDFESVWELCHATNVRRLDAQTRVDRLYRLSH